MAFGGYDAFDDPYAYKGTETLKNKLGLRRPADLEAFELEMSTLRSREPLPSGALDSRHLRAIHRHLFQDVYRWAGKYRTIRTSKGGNLFCLPEHIEGQVDAQIARLHAGPCLTTADRDEFVEAAAEFLAEINAIHPFREGNGRTQLSFMYIVSVVSGHVFDLSAVRQETFLPAMIASFHGDLLPLKRELAALLI